MPQDDQNFDHLNLRGNLGWPSDTCRPNRPCPSGRITGFTSTIELTCSFGGKVWFGLGRGSSVISQQDADRKARSEAKRQLAFSSPCKIIYWNVEQAYTAHCPPGFLGSPIVRGIDADLYNSTVSQEHADGLALHAAMVLAFSDLDCEEAPEPGPDDPPAPVIYTSTQSYTASCPNGSDGNSVTRVATRTSDVSQHDADVLATESAQQAAEIALVCNVSTPTFFSTQSFTAICPVGMYGQPKTATRSVTSSISQQDADEKAVAAAREAALNLLSCTDPVGNTPQTFTATCGDDEIGSDVEVTVPENQFFAQYQSQADALALASAAQQATSQLVCHICPDGPFTLSFTWMPVGGMEGERYDFSYSLSRLDLCSFSGTGTAEFARPSPAPPAVFTSNGLLTIDETGSHLSIEIVPDGTVFSDLPSFDGAGSYPDDPRWNDVTGITVT